MRLFLYTTLILLAISCNTNEANRSHLPAIQEPLEGLWQLQTMEIIDSLNEWQEWRNGMQGYLLYDGKGHMALHLIPKGYEDTDLIFPNFTDTISIAALKYITNNYNYFGTYDIDTAQQIVTHTRISHSNPKDWHTSVKRHFSFNGDTLVVKPVEKENARLRLKWLKEN
ncbi:MAG: lipocalin-like domain-containing protein [Putridiphycobacter sp.]|nr:lipocalin-like domain-containing protein [Putridiphycobacter sp.]